MPYVDLQRILVVEDDYDTRHAMADVLASLGFSVDVAATAKDALCHSRLLEAAIVLLDRMLPDATAEEILPEITRLAPDCAVIVLTGHADLDSAIACQRLGAADYLLKPIDADTLKDSIDRFRSARRANQLKLQATRLAAIGDAMTGLSHECRNALQRSQASLDLLTDDLAENRNAVRLVERIQSAQDDLHRIYEAVKSYAAPMKVTPVACRVDSVVRQVWNELATQQNAHSVSLTESLNASTTEIAADVNALHILFRNLFQNALATRDDASIVVGYEDSTLNNDMALLIKVSDNGPGIRGEVRHQAFDEFFTTRMHGTGLGLAICRRIVEAHEGTIELGEPDVGAEFRIILPHKRRSKAI